MNGSFYVDSDSHRYIFSNMSESGQFGFLRREVDDEQVPDIVECSEQ